MSPTSRRWAERWLRSATVVLAAAVITQVAVSVLEQGVPTLAFAFKRDLELSAAQVGLLVSTFNIGRMAGSVPWGRAVDTRGTRWVLAVGGFGLALLAGVASISPDPLVGPALFAAGLFAASATPAGVKLLVGVFPPSKRGTVVGVRQTAIPVGGAIAAFTLPAIAVAVDWRLAIGCAAALVLAASIPVVLVAPVGGGRTAAPDAARRRIAPLPALRAFGQRGVGAATVWGMVLVAAQYGTVTYGILLLESRFGFATGQAALVVGLAQVAGATGRVGWVLVGDRLFRGRPDRTMLALTVLGVAGCAVVVALPAGTAPLLVAIAFLFTGLAVTGWPGLWVSYVSTHTPPERLGSSMGYGNALVNLAALSGPPVLGLVLDATGDHRMLWAVMGLGLAASLLVLRNVADGPEAGYGLH